MIEIVNRSGYPTRRVKAIVRNALADLDVADIFILVRTHRRRHGETRGVYYNGGHVEVSLPPTDVEPSCTWHPYRRKEAPPAFELRGWEEHLAAVVAHEAHHHRQWLAGRPAIEHECDWAAYRAVRRYREQAT